MFGCLVRSNLTSFKRTFSTTFSRSTKVAVLGAAGGIGQPLSLLLKQSPYIRSLNLYDVKNLDGISLELDHIDTSARVFGFTGEDQLEPCLDGAELVIITAGIPRKPGMERKDLFGINAKLVGHFAEKIAKCAYNPFIAVVTNPVNSLVPVVAEVLRGHKMFDVRKLFGVTTLDIVRANTFYAELTGLDARDVHVPVVAGHSGDTIVPLFSIATPQPPTPVNCHPIINEVRNAGTRVVEAKKGDGSATLSMAYSAFRFATSLLQARLGKRDIVDYAYVYAKYHTDVDYFAEPFFIDQEGITEHVPYDKISEYEKGMIAHAKGILKEDIEMGKSFVRENYKFDVPYTGHQIHGHAKGDPIETVFDIPDVVDVEKRKYPVPKSKTGAAKPDSDKDESS